MRWWILLASDTNFGVRSFDPTPEKDYSMNHFVLDANTVIAEQYGASAHMRALLSASSAVGFQVHLPKVALEEIAAKYERELSKNAKEADKNLSRLSWLLGRSIDSPMEGFDPKEETRAFREKLLSHLGMTESHIIDYPDTLHETLVKRATSRKRPFDDNGSGYRDAIIWESVLELATQVKGPIVLVTKDKDFRERSSNLHGDLIKDLERLGLPEDKVILATDLASLVEQHVRPNLGTLPWESRLQFLAQDGVNLEDSIALILLGACSGKEWEPPELGIPWEYESPTLAMIADVSGLTVLDIRQLNSSQVLVKVEASPGSRDGILQFSRAGNAGKSLTTQFSIRPLLGLCKGLTVPAPELFTKI